jgi:hypothetical protein
LLSSSALASLELTRKTYGPEQTFDGYLSINESNVDLDEEITGDIQDCGSYDLKEISLYNFLVNAGLYSGNLYSYEKDGSSFNTINYVEGEEEYGFEISNTLKNLTFDVSENTGEIKIDIGLDGYDWKYLGELDKWSVMINSVDYDESYESYVPNYNNVVLASPKTTRCSNFSIEFDELQTEIGIRVNAVAKRLRDTGGVLKARIVDGDSCDFTEPSSSWTNIYCSLNLDLDERESPIDIDVCVYSTKDSGDGDFQIPKLEEDTDDYYFIRLNSAIYGDYAPNFIFSNSRLKDEVNSYYNSECSGKCVIPFRISGDGSFTLKPTLKFYNNDISNLVYNINTQILDFDLEGKKLELKYFDDLITPDRKDNTCDLEIRFLGEKYTEQFNLTDAPTPEIEISSEFTATGIPVTFDGSFSSGDIISYTWYFGDNSSASGKIVTHSYKEEGDYEIILNVLDSRGVGANATEMISIVNLEEALQEELPSKIEELEMSMSSFRVLKGNLNEFYLGKGFDSIVSNSYDSLKDLENSFNSTKEGNSTKTQKDLTYSSIYSQLINLTEITPKKLVEVGSSSHLNYTPTSLFDIPMYQSLFGLGDLNDVKNEIYLFNQNNVKGDYEYTSIKVRYLSGSERYIYVDKTFRSSVGGELVENLKNYSNIEIFSSGCSFDSSNGVIYCSNVGSDFNLKYSSLSDDIILTSGFIVPNSVFAEAEIIYKYECDGDCDYSYCGDKKCFFDSMLGIDEKDRDNSNYCPQDCGKNIPWIWYIVLFFIVVAGGFWINFYRGPGNFFDVTNKISYKLFKKRLFFIEKDRMVLRTYILRALREGFGEAEIRLALRRKGWTKKQLDFIFEVLKRQKSQAKPL